MLTYPAPDSLIRVSAHPDGFAEPHAVVSMGDNAVAGHAGFAKLNIWTA